jgi:small GTP-binding protein
MKNQEEATGGKREHDMLAKILVIGDGGVGKTALITRFTEDRFVVSYTATIGVDFKSKMISCGDKVLKMQIWDTAGQERFKNITQAYYRGATGILLAFSLADRISFQNIEKWTSQIDENASKDCSRVLVGTKMDAVEERVIGRAEAEALALRMGVTYIETSAKNNEFVAETFDQLGRQIYEIATKKIGRSQLGNVKINSKIFDDNRQERSGCRC